MKLSDLTWRPALCDRETALAFVFASFPAFPPGCVNKNEQIDYNGTLTKVKTETKHDINYATPQMREGWIIQDFGVGARCALHHNPSKNNHTYNNNT